MSCKPEELLVLAKIIQELRPTSDTADRAVISRSYYSMYHKVLSILDKTPRTYENKGVHASLIKYLSSDAASDESIDFNSLKSLSYMLKQEKDNRVLADYQIKDEIGENVALRSLATAERFINKCDQLSANIKQQSVI